VLSSYGPPRKPWIKRKKREDSVSATSIGENASVEEKSRGS
jgi:hypothetical protein